MIRIISFRVQFSNAQLSASILRLDLKIDSERSHTGLSEQSDLNTAQLFSAERQIKVDYVGHFWAVRDAAARAPYAADQKNGQNQTELQ